MCILVGDDVCSILEYDCLYRLATLKLYLIDGYTSLSDDILKLESQFYVCRGLFYLQGSVQYCIA